MKTNDMTYKQKTKAKSMDK